MKTLRRAVHPRLSGRGARRGAFALVFGYFCVRLTKIYFAMLTLAFSQIVWAICFKWNDVTGGDQGLPDIPFPDLGLDVGAARASAICRIGDRFYLLRPRARHGVARGPAPHRAARRSAGC